MKWLDKSFGWATLGWVIPVFTILSTGILIFRNPNVAFVLPLLLIAPLIFYGPMVYILSKLFRLVGLSRFANHGHQFTGFNILVVTLMAFLLLWRLWLAAAP